MPASRRLDLGVQAFGLQCVQASRRLDLGLHECPVQHSTFVFLIKRARGNSHDSFHGAACARARARAYASLQVSRRPGVWTWACMTAQSSTRLFCVSSSERGGKSRDGFHVAARARACMRASRSPASTNSNNSSSNSSTQQHQQQQQQQHATSRRTKTSA